MNTEHTHLTDSIAWTFPEIMEVYAAYIMLLVTATLVAFLTIGALIHAAHNHRPARCRLRYAAVAATACWLCAYLVMGYNPLHHRTDAPLLIAVWAAYAGVCSLEIRTALRVWQRMLRGKKWDSVPTAADNRAQTYELTEV